MLDFLHVHLMHLHTHCLGCFTVINGCQKIILNSTILINYFLCPYKITCNRVNRKPQTNCMCRVYVTAPLNLQDDITPRRRLQISIRCCFSFIKRVIQSAACFSLARWTVRPCTYLNISSEMRQNIFYKIHFCNKTSSKLYNIWWSFIDLSDFMLT